jgi:hypothetical protein
LLSNTTNFLSFAGTMLLGICSGDALSAHFSADGVQSASVSSSLFVSTSNSSGSDEEQW